MGQGQITFANVSKCVTHWYGDRTLANKKAYSTTACTKSDPVIATTLTVRITRLMLKPAYCTKTDTDRESIAIALDYESSVKENKNLQKYNTCNFLNKKQNI